MVSRCDLRKQAYDYIVNKLGRMYINGSRNSWSTCIPLEELRALKEGKQDPSVTLVNVLKELLKGVVKDTEIDAHLVDPFKGAGEVTAISKEEA